LTISPFFDKEIEKSLELKKNSVKIRIYLLICFVKFRQIFDIKENFELRFII
jgi:hypothetical protein